MTRAGTVSDITNRSIRKFNPGTFQSDEEVIEQFVVRKRELGIVLEVLGGNIESPSCQHSLVVAPRGRGKTMLLARAAAELRTDDALSGYLLPVRFMEESQEIFNLADFWLETLFHLARESTVQDLELARELRETHDTLSDCWRDQALEKHAHAAVLDAADRLGRKLVLMVENLQSLCENVDESFGWKLRGVLQSEPQIILLASATSRFEGLDDARQPFFELFRIVGLDPLSTEDCRCLWQVVSGDAVSGREIRPLQILTGGSPRLLVIVAGFARHRSLRQLMEELVTLIDEHTEYFRGHLEALAKTERRVYLSVIDLWQPSRTGEIAARARMDIRVVSTMLGRLIHRGAVILEGSGKKRLYVAAERLYSIYYKLRRERDEAAVVRNLIHFMAAFYSESELFDMSDQLSLEAAASPIIREGIERAITELPPVDDNFSRTAWLFKQISNRAAAKYHREIERQIDEALREKAFRRVIEIADQAFASQGADSSQMSESPRADILHKRAFACEQLGDLEAAIAAYEEVVARFGDSDVPDLQRYVASAWFGKGAARKELGDLEAAIAAYEEVVARFGDSDAPDLQRYVASAWFGKGAARKELGDLEAAIAAYEEVVARFGDSDAPDLQRYVASAWFGKGDARKKLGDLEAAIAAYEEVVARFGDSDAPELQWWVASAWFGKGAARKKLGDLEAAIAAYEEVVARFGDSDAPELQWWVASAWFGKGDARKKLGDLEAAIAAYEEVVARFGDSDAPELQWWVASAWFGKGAARKELGDLEAAIAAYEEVVARFGDSDAPELQWWVASAWFDKGAARKELGDLEAAIAAYEEVVARFGDSDVPELQRCVALALVDKGDARKELGDLEAAIAAYEEVVARFGDSDVPELQRCVALALGDKGMRQTEIGLIEESLETSKELEQRIGTSLAGGEEIKFAWRAMCVRTKALLIQKDRRAAMDAFRTAYVAFIPDNKTMMWEMLRFVPDLIATGASEHDLVEVLSSDSTKSDMLEPLIVALREYGGEKVRAPEEVLEVAADIRKKIEEIMTTNVPAVF